MQFFFRDPKHPDREPLYSPPVPLPESWSNHGLLPALSAIFLDYVDLVITAIVLASNYIGRDTDQSWR